MCAQNGQPACGCAHQPAQSGAPSGSVNPSGTWGTDVTGTPRFTQAVTMAQPLKAQVDSGYIVPGSMPGQMMTTLNGGTLALYEDLYGGADYDGQPVSVRYGGTWGGIFAAGKA